jgi:hypothetical protein
VLGCVLTLVACGSDSGTDPEETGRRDRAVMLLRGYGLDEEGARCITDKLGSQTVVESMDMDILASGQAYQDAAEACGR